MKLLSTKLPNKFGWSSNSVKITSRSGIKICPLNFLFFSLFGVLVCNLTP